MRGLLSVVMTCALLAPSTAALAQTAPASNATVKCGRLAGLSDKPGWETPAIYKIEGNKITFERILSASGETQAWSGVKGFSGQMMLVGEGGDKSSRWVMEFTGKWAGEHKTTLTGKFTDTSGSQGYRICRINM